jgi:hypothetical protein
MTVHSMPGLFLTCTHCSCLSWHNVQLIVIYIMYRTVITEPLAKVIKNPDLLGGPVFCSGWRIPIHSGPLPGNYCPTLWLLPLSPLPHPLSPHYTIYHNDIDNPNLLCPGHLDYLRALYKRSGWCKLCVFRANTLTWSEGSTVRPVL